MSDAKLEQYAEVISGQHVMAGDVNEAKKGSPYLTGPADFPDGKVVITKFTEAGSKFCQKGDLLVTVKGSGVGKTAVADSDYAISRQLMAIRAKRGKNQEFINFCLQSYFSELSRRAVGSIPGLSRHDLLSAPVLDCNSEEQQKIVEILSDCDTAIQKSDDLHLKLSRSLQGIRLKIFEEEIRRKTSMRFAKEIFEPVSQRGQSDLPLLAVLQDGGVVKRDDLERRVVMPEGGTSNYKIVSPGNFVISLRSFEGGLEYSNIEGLVSPAYTVLKNKNKICDDYYRHYFKSSSFIRRLDKLIFGIRDGKQISFRDFGDLKIPFPEYTEQLKFAAIMNEVESSIAKEEERNKTLKQQKRGLMQQLLTGKLRVKGAA